jgi:hypothetical protein
MTNSQKKYKIIEDSKINFLGIDLFRIQAVESFGNVKEGEIGGYIEKYSNLSGDAWVYGDARVYGDAQVYGDARVYGDAWVYGNARVYGDVRVYGNEKIDRKICIISTEIWSVTFGQQIIIGCKRHTSEEWANFSDEEISKMDVRALNWWKKWREIVLSTAKIAIFEPKI